MPVLDAILGGETRLLTVQARTVPPEIEGGYTSWHRVRTPQPDCITLRPCRDTCFACVVPQDMANTPHQWPFPINRRVKAFIYMFDVAEDQGCTSVVRGSHRIPWGPGGVYDLRSAGFSGFTGSGRQADGRPRSEEEGFAPTGSIQNHVKFAAKAGDCCVFDIATWHTAQPNRSARERENLILMFSGSAGTSRTKPYGELGEESVARLRELGRLDEATAAVLGV